MQGKALKLDMHVNLCWLATVPSVVTNVIASSVFFVSGLLVQGKTLKLDMHDELGYSPAHLTS